MREVANLLVHLAERGRRLRRHAILHHLEPALRCGQRRAQLVRHVGDEGAPERALALELAGHRVERGRQVGHFARSAGLDTPRGAAGRQVPGRRPELRNRPDRAARDDPHRRQRRDADDRRDQHEPAVERAEGRGRGALPLDARERQDVDRRPPPVGERDRRPVAQDPQLEQLGAAGLHRPHRGDRRSHGRRGGRERRGGPRAARRPHPPDGRCPRRARTARGPRRGGRRPPRGPRDRSSGRRADARVAARSSAPRSAMARRSIAWKRPNSVRAP